MEITSVGRFRAVPWFGKKREAEPKLGAASCSFHDIEVIAVSSHFHDPS